MDHDTMEVEDISIYLCGTDDRRNDGDGVYLYLGMVGDGAGDHGGREKFGRRKFGFLLT